MSTTATTATKKCGYCATGSHTRCPSGVKHRDGVIFRCSCGCERSQQTRCLVCNNREQQDIHWGTWQCIDRAACEARVETSMASNPTIMQIRRIKADIEQRKSTERQERTPRAPRTLAKQDTPAPGGRKQVRAVKQPRPCTCGCGGSTKGGLFLPGHDSKYLTMVVESVTEHGATVEGVAQTMEREGCSPALIAKFRKRVA